MPLLYVPSYPPTSNPTTVSVGSVKQPISKRGKLLAGWRYNPLSKGDSRPYLFSCVDYVEREREGLFLLTPEINEWWCVYQSVCSKLTAKTDEDIIERERERKMALSILGAVILGGSWTGIYLVLTEYLMKTKTKRRSTKQKKHRQDLYPSYAVWEIPA